MQDFHRRPVSWFLFFQLTRRYLNIDQARMLSMKHLTGMLNFRKHSFSGKNLDVNIELQERINTLEKINEGLRVELKDQHIKIGQLKESEERFRMLVESSPNAILLTDGLNEIKMINNQAEVLLGYERDELVGTSIEVLIPQEFRIKHRKHSQYFFDHPKARKIGRGRDLTALHKTGREIPVEIGLTPLHTHDRLMVLITLIDITERKKQEEQLRHQNQELLQSSLELEKRTLQLIQSEKLSALGTLVAGVAHELNNPLTGILHFAQYLQKNPEKVGKSREVIDEIITETRRCAEIVKNLLQYAYPNEVQPRGMLDALSFQGLIHSINQLFAIKNKDIQFDVKVEDTFNGFSFNHNKLHQIMTNLIGNAVDALETCRKKEISVIAYSDKTHNHILLEDTGIGMDSDRLKKIFDPFYTTKEVGKGTGLGLSITKRIIEENGGTIDVESYPGKGTTIRLKFPVTNEQTINELYEQATGNR